MNSYKYTGTIEIVLPQLGLIKPEETIHTRLTINHPHFVKIEEKQYSKKNKKNYKLTV